MEAQYRDEPPWYLQVGEDFSKKARQRNIDISITSQSGVEQNPESFITFFEKLPKTA